MAIPALTLRNTKGSALTFTEMDNNLTNLQTANIVLAVTGSSSTTLALNDTLTLSPGTGISLSNTSGNVTITNTYSNVQVASYLVANPPAGTYSNVQVASYVAGNITVGNIAGKTSGFTLGYLEMPQVAAANVTLALADSGKHFYDTSTAPITVTIPNNANVAFNTGTVVSLVNNSTGNLIIGRQDAVSLYLGGNATSAGRTITSYGVATLMKVDTNTWFVNGSGVV
jgi:hypothetical protein